MTWLAENNHADLEFPDRKSLTNFMTPEHRFFFVSGRSIDF